MKTVLEDLIETLMDFVNQMYMHRGQIGETTADAFYKELLDLLNRLKQTK